MSKLEVDCFEIDIETFADADGCSHRGQWINAMLAVVDKVMQNLTIDSKKRFEEYQNKNDPCNEGE